MNPEPTRGLAYALAFRLALLVTRLLLSGVPYVLAAYFAGAAMIGGRPGPALLATIIVAVLCRPTIRATRDVIVAAADTRRARP